MLGPSDRYAGLGNDVVSVGHLDALSGGWFLTDSIVNFYLTYLDRLLTVDVKSKVHIFSSFFFTKMYEKGFDSVKTWTRGVNIFDKDFLIVPVNQSLH